MGYHIPPLEVRKVAGGWNAYPPSVKTGDNLTIFPNYADTYPTIILKGTGDLVLQNQGSFKFVYNTTEFLNLYLNAGHCYLQSKENNKDLYLLTSGSGVVGFGTHTGSGDVACNGSILVKDSGGTLRKLMTTA